MEINEEVLVRAIAYANKRVPADRDARIYFKEGSEGERSLAKSSLKEDYPDWHWEVYVRAYYDGVQSVYTELEAAHNEMTERLNADTIPAGPSKEFDL